MKKIILSAVLALSVTIFAGCQGTSVFSIGGTIKNEQAPPEVIGGGGEKTTTTIKASAKWCLPDCPKPSFNEIKDSIQKINMVLEQTNTYSSAINNKAYVEFYNGNNMVASSAFDIVQVGNQFRFASPTAVATWTSNQLNLGNTLVINLYLETVGFAGEYVTARIRHGAQTIESATGFIEIDCGDGNPSGSPATGCVIVP
ncbi:MAG: hypothetical protein ACK4NN_15975 [Rheinheimera sp.]